MPKYFLNGKETEFKQGEKLSDAAKLIQKDFKYDIVLFEADGKIKELHTPIKENMRLTPITADTPIG
ncbi:MAG: hypothetical protein LUG66_04785, partial [Clostridiales bacterium]|nr:hypothetical protein [Clostridiales bacterium]